MDWSNERYVRLYVRETTTLRALCWEAQALLPQMLRIVDRAGVLDIGKRDPAEAIGLYLQRWPKAVIDAGLKGLVDEEVLVLGDGAILWPEFLEAQDAVKSDKQRARESRERRRADVTQRDACVTKRTDTSRPVTGRHAPSLQPTLPEPTRDDQNPSADATHWPTKSGQSDSAGAGMAQPAADAGADDSGDVASTAPRAAGTKVAARRIRTRRGCAPCSTEFDAALALYPKRDGDNSSSRAWRAWQARLREGATAEEMSAGVGRYAAWVRARGKEGSEFVKQAATFFGPEYHFRQPWAVKSADNEHLPAQVARRNGDRAAPRPVGKEFS